MDPFRLEDSRRLTGPNLLLDGPGAVVDVALPEAQAAAAVEVWTMQARALLEAVGWGDAALAARRYTGGASLAFSAPIDALYAATEVNETAWEAAVAVLTGSALVDLHERAPDLARRIAGERNPALLALRHAADAYGIRFLSDDDEASVGSGAGAHTWSIDALPDPADVDWTAAHDVPVALVTGTNGKSTTVRLAASILQAAGRTPGSTSTDFIRVGDDTLDTGDYSGPGGGRTVLRDRRVEAAVLEVARGGILRRGLAVRRVEAAVVTNIARDHLGEYGIFDLDGLAEAKLVVAKALTGGGTLILNADDPLLVRHARRLDVPICWFGLDADNPTVRDALDAGGRACFVDDGRIVWASGTERTPVAAVESMPVTLGGAARHNVANSLAAAALTRALGVAVPHVAAGLQALRGDADDNPGRGNLFEIDGARVVLDFAHNVAGVEAIVETLRQVPARRRLVLLGQAGDRTDDDVRALTRAAAAWGPDRVVVCEFVDYLRGRPAGEVPAVIRDELRRLGVPEAAIVDAGDGPEGARTALDWAEPGDVLLLLAHSKRDEVLALLRARARAGEGKL